MTLTDPQAPRSSVSPAVGASLHRRALWAEWLTIVWNAFEGAAAIFVGVSAGSVALVAFGLDSAIEVFASAVVVWQLVGAQADRERLALRLIGVSYLVVAVYILVDATDALVMRTHPGAAPLGVALTAGTVCVMTLLGAAKQRIGTQLASSTVLADARFSFVDAALAAAVLVGLSLNWLAGWWWADPALALLIAAVALREGVEGVQAG
jgi:divalent metal cation (Fe/Co/Zn/Cd) transporter